MLKRLFDILLLLLIAQTVWAQRLIRSCSRYYVEEQALPQRVEPAVCGGVCGDCHDAGDALLGMAKEGYWHS